MDNNFIIAAIPYVFGVGLSVWLAYEIYDTYQKAGPKAALLKAGIEVTTVIVGGVVVKNIFKVAGNIYKTADKAWEAYLYHNPNILVITEIFKQSVGKVGNKISNKVVGSKPVQKMLYLHKLNRIRNSLGVNSFYGKTPQQIHKKFVKKGFDVKFYNPDKGIGSYLYSKNMRKYYLDKGKKYKKGFEYPHVDVHRKNIETGRCIEESHQLPKNSKLKEPKRKYPLGDKLVDKNNQP